MGFLSDLGHSLESAYRDSIDLVKNPFSNNGFNAGHYNVLLGGAVGLTNFAIEASKSQWNMVMHAIIPDTRQDREVMSSSTLNARKLVYGVAKVAGQLVYIESSGEDNEFLYAVVVFTGHTIDGFQEVYFNDELAATVSGGVVTVLAPFTDVCAIEAFDGTQTTACATLVTASNGLWTADHKLQGCSYLYLRLTYDETAYANGLPNITAVVKGKNDIYDPETTLTGWTDNPAICIRDYMLMPVERGGMGCSPSEVDELLVIAAKAVCAAQVAEGAIYSGETLVKASGNVSRYRCNGVISLEGTPADIVNSMLTCMIGEVVYSEGVWKIYAGKYDPAASVPVIDESWLAGPIQFSAGPSKSDKLNTLKGTFVDPYDSWATKEFAIVTVPAYVTEDNEEELLGDVTFNFTTSENAARTLAKIILDRSRITRTIQMSCNHKAFRLAPHDIVYVSTDLLGWDEQVYRVTSWSFGTSGSIELSLTQEVYTSYDGQDGEAIVLPLPTILPNAYSVIAPTNLQYVATVVDYNEGANTRVDVAFSWTAGQVGTMKYRLQFRMEGAGVWLDSQTRETTSTGLTVEAMPSGAYEVRVQAINSIGAQSPWLTVHDVLIPNSDDSVPNVTGLEIFGQGTDYVFGGNEVHLRWYQVSPRITVSDYGPVLDDSYTWFKCYILRIYNYLGQLMRTEYPISEEYTYTYENNVADTIALAGGTPFTFTAKAWRFNISANTGNIGNTQITEIELFNDKGQDICDLIAGVASASSVWSGKPASNAFDNDRTTSWVSEAQAVTLTYTFVTPVNISSYSMQAFPSAADLRAGPMAWTFQYLDDNGDWITVTTVSEQAQWDYNEIRNFAGTGETGTITGSASRALIASVTALAVWDEESAVPNTISVSNPTPPACTFTVTEVFKGLEINISPSTDRDVAGYIIHASPTASYDPSAATLVTDGFDTHVTITALEDGTPLAAGTWYIKVGAYDLFDKESINWGTEVSGAYAYGQIGVDELYTTLRVDFLINDSRFYFGDDGEAPTAATKTTLYWTAGTIIRDKIIYDLSAGNITTAQNQWIVATLTGGVAGGAHGTAALSKVAYSAGIPDLDNGTEIIIAYTSSAANGAGNYMCYVRQANSVMFEGADIRDLTVTTLKVGHEAVTVPIMEVGSNVQVDTTDWHDLVATVTDFDPMGGGAIVTFSAYCDTSANYDGRVDLEIYVGGVLKFAGIVGINVSISGGGSADSQIWMPFSHTIGMEGPISTAFGVSARARSVVGNVLLGSPTIAILGARR